MVSSFRRFIAVVVYVILPSLGMVLGVVMNGFAVPDHQVIIVLYFFVSLLVIITSDIWYLNIPKKGKAIDYEIISVQYDDAKKILVYLISMLIIIMVLGGTIPRVSDGSPVILRSSFLGLTLYLVVTIWVFRLILILLVKRESRLYLAKGYCITATKKEDEFEKSGYILSTLNSYNKYLRRRSHIEIKYIKMIYAAILMADTEERNQMIKSIYESLASDRLELARYLNTVYKVPGTEFFVGESLRERLKVVGTVAVTVIPIIISIIQLARVFGLFPS